MSPCALLCVRSGCGVPLVHLPAVWAAGALQPDLPQHAAGGVPGPFVAVSGGVPQGDYAVVVG